MLRIRTGLPRPRDTQRQRVYTWEDKDLCALTDRLLTLEEGRALCVAAWRIYRREWLAPTFINGRVTGRGSCYRVTVPSAIRTPHIVLHETAHAILHSYPHLTAWHGPEFVRLLIDLLARFDASRYVQGKRRLAQSARQRRIKIASRLRLQEMSQK